jgi:hypothetical protein
MRPVRKADKLSLRLWADCLENVGSSMRHNLWATTVCYRDGFAFFLPFIFTQKKTF